MERYVDGYVLPVPNDSLEAYQEMAAEAGEVWMKHGALAYFEGAGDDLAPDVRDTSMRTFPGFAGAGEDESVIFAFVTFESREHRDEVNAKAMDDPAMDPESFEEETPFDRERMAYGGFRSLVSYEE